MSTSEAKATAKVRPSRDAWPRDPVEYVWGFRRSRMWLADVGLSRLRAVAGEGHVVGFGVLASGELGGLRCHHDAPKLEVQNLVRGSCEFVCDLREMLGPGARPVKHAWPLRWHPRTGEIAIEVYDDERRVEVVLVEPGRGIVSKLEVPESHTVIDVSYAAGLIALNDRRDARPILVDFAGDVRARSKLPCEHHRHRAFSPSGALMNLRFGAWACVWRWADDQKVWSEELVHGAVGWGPSDVLAYVRDGYAAMTWDAQTDERTTLLELESMRSDRAKRVIVSEPAITPDGRQFLFTMCPFQTHSMLDQPPEVSGFPMLAAIDLAHDELALVTSDLGNFLRYSY